MIKWVSDHKSEPVWLGLHWYKISKILIIKLIFSVYGIRYTNIRPKKGGIRPSLHTWDDSSSIVDVQRGGDSWEREEWKEKWKSRVPGAVAAKWLMWMGGKEGPRVEWFLGNIQLGHGRNFSPVRGWIDPWGHGYMTSSKFSDLCNLPCYCHTHAFAHNLSALSSAFTVPPSPPSVDIMCTCPLRMVHLASAF